MPIPAWIFFLFLKLMMFYIFMACSLLNRHPEASCKHWLSFAAPWWEIEALFKSYGFLNLGLSGNVPDSSQQGSCRMKGRTSGSIIQEPTWKGTWTKHSNSSSSVHWVPLVPFAVWVNEVIIAFLFKGDYCVCQKRTLNLTCLRSSLDGVDCASISMPWSFLL